MLLPATDGSYALLREVRMLVHFEKTHAELMEQTNRIGVDFLKVEVEAVLTFIRVAETSTSPVTRARNYGNALIGYRTLLHYLPRIVLTKGEMSEFRQKLEDLKLRLEEAGYSSDAHKPK